MADAEHQANFADIIIQEVAEGKIKLQVNGETQEIQNQLSELKSLLSNLKVQNVQYAEKIYNIEHIDEANFGFVTGNKAFNELLTKQLIEALRPHSETARRFLERVATIKDWEKQARISDKAKEIIAYSYVGVIGVQLSKLMAIGKEDFSESKQRKYIEKCLAITKQCLNLVCFALISKCWDEQKRKQSTISEAQQEALRHSFDDSFEPSIEELFVLLRILHEIFSLEENELSLPIPELAGFEAHLVVGSDFQQACEGLQDLNIKFDKAQYDLLDCAQAEKLMANFFTHFHFLGNYKMASIKQISFEQMRNNDPRYLHRYAALGIDHKANQDAELINYTQETVPTDAVLLYRGDDYRESINLFPFVIDYNALTFEQGSKICFFHSKDLTEDNCYDYRFLEDNSTIQLAYEGIVREDTDFNTLMLNDDYRKKLNIDKVIELYQAARNALLPNEINLDDL